MTTPETSRPEERLITDDTFTRLRDAARNLFAYGPHADQDYAVFGDLVIEEGAMPRFEPKDLRQRPTHVYSGAIYPYESRSPRYQVWKRFEGSAVLEGALHNTVAEPTYVVREDNICKMRGHTSRKDTVLSADGRAFELFSTLAPNFMHAVLSFELNDAIADESAQHLAYLVERAKAACK